MGNKIKKIVLFLILILYSGSVFSDNSSKEIQNEIADNISSEFNECAAYFYITFGAMEKFGDVDTAKRFSNLSDRALGYGIESFMLSGTNEMAKEVSESRFKMNMKRMMKDINSNYSNLSILTKDYGERCMYIMKKPTEMIIEWDRKIYKKYGLTK